MAFFSWSAVAFSAAVTGAAYILVLIGQFLLQTRRPKNYPPGPPILLGLGNLHQMPLQRPFLKFHEWSKIYGDIVGLKMGPKNMIIIFSPEYVRELFQKRGAKYSGRPHATIPLEHIIKPEDKLNHILWMQDDSRLRRWRTAARHILGSEGVERVMPLQAATAQKLAYSVLHDTDPDAYTKHSHEWSLATPLLALTGQRIEEFGPGFVESYQKAQHDW
jgi:cytochrome P450